MRKINYIILLLILIIAIISLFVYLKKEPITDAEYLEIVKKYNLNEDGSIDFTYHHKVKLNSYYAINHLGDDFIIYNPEYQKLEIIKSETKMNDGTIVKTPENGYNEFLPQCASNAPSYNQLRQMAVTHTGLDIGSIINFKYSLHTQNDFFPSLMGEEIFATFYPVKKMKVIITVPADKKLNYDLKNCTKKPKIKNKNNTKTFIWNFKNIPVVVKENDQSELGEFSPRLIFSTVNSWENLGKYVNSLVESSMKKNTKLKADIKKDLPIETDNLLKIIATQKEINENVGLTKCLPVTYGYKTKSVSKTFYENNGSAFDKALLLTTYLQCSNIQSTPILVSKYNDFSTKVPSLFQFDDFLVLCNDTSGEIYLNPTHEQKNNFHFNIVGKTILNFNDKSKPLTKIQKDTNTKNSQKIDLNINIEDDLTLKGNYKLTFSGIFNPYYDLYKDEKNVKKEASGIINDAKIDSAKISEMDQNRSIINVKFHSDDTLEIKNDYIRWKLPQFSQGFNNREISVAQINRQTPLNLKHNFCENYIIKINFADSIKCLNPDTIKTLTNELGSVNIEFQKDGNALLIKKKLIINKSTIQPKSYNDFRKLIVIWQNPHLNELVLYKIKNNK